MYRWLRNLHLALGLFVLPFVLVYALSALQMAHPKLLRANIATRSWTVELPASQASHTPEAAQHALEVLAGVRGELKRSTQHDGVLTLELERPGMRYDIEVHAGRHAKITEQRGDLVRVLNRLHHAAGLSKTVSASVLWGALVIAVSLGLLGLGVTGIWMWLTRKAERRIGLLFLGTSVLVCCTLLVLIRLS